MVTKGSSTRPAKRPRKSTTGTSQAAGSDVAVEDEPESLGTGADFEAVLRAYHKKQLKKEAATVKKLNDDLASVIDGIKKRVDAKVKSSEDRIDEQMRNVELARVEVDPAVKMSRLAKQHGEIMSMVIKDTESQVEAVIDEREIECVLKHIDEITAKLQADRAKSCKRLGVRSQQLHESQEASAKDMAGRYKHLKHAFTA